MKRKNANEVVCVRLPARLKKKLGDVARQLHCTPAEAALLAIKTQLAKPDAPLFIPFSESPVPSSDK